MARSCPKFATLVGDLITHLTGSLWAPDQILFAKHLVGLYVKFLPEDVDIPEFESYLHLGREVYQSAVAWGLLNDQLPGHKLYLQMLSSTALPVGAMAAQAA